MSTRRAAFVSLTFLGLLLLVAVGIYLLFASDMRKARMAAGEGSRIAGTAAGPIEYGEVGEGPPLLFIHGAGGGFDAGLRDAASLAGGGFRVIAPSRFGYLKTPLPDDVSPAAQADAHAALLDALGIRKVAVAGVSAGTRSALEFALRHPDRVTALVLIVPATYSPDMPSVSETRRRDYPVLLWLVNNGADFVWWTLEKVAPSVLVRFVGVPPELLDTASSSDRAMVTRLVSEVEPLGRRFPGINVDSQPDLSERPLGQIGVPVLIVSARDDLFNTAPPAEYAAARIRGAQLVMFETGGHLLVGHQDEVADRVRAFLAAAGTVPTGQ